MSTTIQIQWDERFAIDWALREDGMSAAALAKEIGMDPSKLSRIISGEQKKLPLDELKRIAEGQGRPLSYYTETPRIHVMSSGNVILLPTLRGRRTTDWDGRPMEVYANGERLRAA